VNEFEDAARGFEPNGVRVDDAPLVRIPVLPVLRDDAEDATLLPDDDVAHFEPNPPCTGSFFASNEEAEEKDGASPSSSSSLVWRDSRFVDAAPRCDEADENEGRDFRSSISASSSLASLLLPLLLLLLSLSLLQLLDSVGMRFQSTFAASSHCSFLLFAALTPISSVRMLPRY
jgi:hypothetical protein